MRGDHGEGVVSIPARFRGRARRDAAAFYLSQLARGILTGELGILTEHETVPVAPTDFLVLEIAVTRKRRVDRVSVQVRWPRAPTLNRAPATRRRSRLASDPSPAAGHPQFTFPSSRRNPERRDSHPDADHG
jgi:hypothetical protein